MAGNLREQLSDPTVAAARVMGEDWPRSFLSGTVVPQGWIALVEAADGGHRLAPAGEDPHAKQGDSLLLVRRGRVEIPLSMGDLPAADDHYVSVTLALEAYWEPQPDNLAALRKTLMCESTLTVERLSEALTAAGAAGAVRGFVRKHAAGQLVHGDYRGPLFEAIKEGLKRFAFDTGVALERLTSLRFVSQTLNDQERREREAAQHVADIKAREAVEQAAAEAALRRLDDVAELLQKLRAAAGASQDLRWHKLLPSLSPTERSRLLENLWRVTPNARTAERIVVVAGNECLWLDPAQPETIARRLRLSEDLGPLRSVSHAPQSDALLVGAATGVWLIEAHGGEIISRFDIPCDEPPSTGVNGATIAGERMFATHSALGCWMWPLEDPSSASSLLRPVHGSPRSIRAVTALKDGRVVFSADDCIHVYDPATETLDLLGSVSSSIHALATTDSRLYAGTADGQLLRLDLDPIGAWTLVHRTFGAIESIDVRRWSDLIEIVIPAHEQGVSGVYGDEAAVARLCDAPTPIRRVWASDDLIVGLNDRRDKLLVMSAQTPGREPVEAPIARLVGRSVQDACLVVRDNG